MSQEKQKYLEAMGIEIWQQRVCETNCSDNSNNGFKELAQQIANCTLCGLCKSRTNVVFGAGNNRADLMFVGEAPGATEDAQGMPFVGRAGKLLDSMLTAIGLKRDDVFISNILKCRPPNNRDPLPSEVETCTPYLQKQIQFIQPKLIVALGRIAAHFLLNTDTALGKLRGRVYRYGVEQTPLLVTYHPAYMLRSPREKSKAYVDLLHMRRILDGVN